MLGAQALPLGGGHHCLPSFLIQGAQVHNGAQVHLLQMQPWVGAAGHTGPLPRRWCSSGLHGNGSPGLLPITAWLQLPRQPTGSPGSRSFGAPRLWGWGTALAGHCQPCSSVGIGGGWCAPSPGQWPEFAARLGACLGQRYLGRVAPRTQNQTGGPQGPNKASWDPHAFLGWGCVGKFSSSTPTASSLGCRVSSGAQIPPSPPPASGIPPAAGGISGRR